MKIAITGSSGLVGKATTLSLETHGDEVVRLVRVPTSLPGTLFWDPEKGILDGSSLEGIDAVVNLAGDNIASGRWTEAKKKRLRDSRVLGTQLLCNTLAKLRYPPKVLISASAVGYYGNRGSEALTEESASGQGFLASVCREWEAATRPAADRGIRVVHLRLGAVMSGEGGVLAKMLMPFKLGLGGVVGSGGQWMSWITLEDAVRVIRYAMDQTSLSGPINVVAPNPVTNYTFTKTLGRALHRPTFLPLPAPIARLVLGEMADELLLSSQKAVPAKLLHHGFNFHYPDLDKAIQKML